MDTLAATPGNVLRTIGRFPPDRIAGSQAEREASNVVLEELSKADIRACVMEVDVPSYRASTSNLVVDSSQGPVQLECYPYLGTLPFRNAVFTDLVVMDGDGTIIGARRHAQGPAVLVTQEKCNERLLAILQEQGLDAFIHVLGPQGPLQFRLARCGPPGAGPSVRGAIITYAAAQMLLKSHGNCQIHLSTASSMVMAKGTNVIVNEQALDRPDGILVSAHLDTVLGTPGIGDNAVGCAILLEMCKGLMSTPFASRLCFVWTTGEEYGGEGIRALCERWKARRPPSGLLAIILDALGGAISRDEVKVFMPTGHTQQGCLVSKLVSNREVHQGERPRNDGGPLFDIGVPCIAVHRYGGYMHAQDDSIDKITSFGIARSVDLAIRVLGQVLGIEA